MIWAYIALEIVKILILVFCFWALGFAVWELIKELMK